MFGIFKRAKSVDEIAREIDGFGGSSIAGVAVTERTALETATVLACVETIADGICVPEMHVMRDLGDGKKEKATDSQLYRLLHRRPNEFQTSFEFRQTLTAHAALTGNGYALPVRSILTGEIEEILPLMPHQVVVQQNARYQTTYTITDEFGTIGTFAQSDIFHLRNLSWDRVKGLGALQTARKAIGLSIATEDNVIKLQENGGRPSGILTTDQKLSAEAVERVKEGWARVTSGSKKAGTALLDNGLKWQAVMQSAADAQTMETRRLQVEEICRAFGVFPIMVGHSDKTATYASAEAFFAANNRKTVAKWQRNWCEKVDEFILDGAGPLFVEFENAEIRTASLKDQGEFFAKALGTGGGVPFMTINEVRAAKGMGPIEGGNDLRIPAATTQDGSNDQENEQDDEQDSSGTP